MNNYEKNLNFKRGKNGLGFDEENERDFKEKQKTKTGLNFDGKNEKMPVAADIRENRNIDVKNNINLNFENTKNDLEKYRLKPETYKAPEKTQTEINREKPLKEKLSLEHMINLAGVNYIDNPVVKFGATRKYGKETAENLHMSKKDYYLNTDYAKDHLIFNNYKEVNSELQPYLKDKITKQIGADKLEKTKGIYFQKDDLSSKDLAKEIAVNG